MKILIIGGTGGIGKPLAEHLNADVIGRSNGFDVTNVNILEKCENYDIIINTLPIPSQFVITSNLVDHLEKLQKNTQIITFGTTGSRTKKDWKCELAEWNDSLTMKLTTTKHTLLNISWAWNCVDSVPINKISKENIEKLVDIILDISCGYYITELTVKGN
jgi:hypothetical protein